MNLSDVTPPLSSSELKEKNIFPIDGLPIVIKQYAQNIATVYGIPLEMAAMPMLVACGSVLQKKIWLESGKYKNYAQFYVVINTPSGVGKTEPLKRAFAPLQIIDRANFEIYYNDMKEWRAKSKLCKLHKPPLEEPTRPFYKQLLCDDTTPEALTDILYNNDGSGTVFYEELSGWYGNFGRYTKSSEAQMYLQYFDNTDKTINRKEEIKRIKEPFLNIIGTIQPRVLQSTVSSEAMQECGLASRFLYVTCLDVQRPYKNELLPDDNLAKEYQYLINHLAGITDRFPLYLTDEAKELFKNFGDYLTDNIRSSKNEFLNSSLSKMEIHCLRLALVLQVIKLTEPNKRLENVGEETMQYAIDLCHYFIGNIPLPQKTELVKMETKTFKVLEMLKKGMKQVDIAAELHVSQQYVSTIKKKYKITI
jgi:hypothetical protein